MKTRKQIIDELRKLREEIQLDLNGVAYWNDYVRKPGEETLVADPGGELGEIIGKLDAFFAGEKPDLTWTNKNPMTAIAESSSNEEYVCLHYHTDPCDRWEAFRRNKGAGGAVQWQGSRNHFSRQSAQDECEDSHKGLINLDLT